MELPQGQGSPEEEEAPPAINVERMSVEQVFEYCRELSAKQEIAFSLELAALPERNIDKAREVIRAFVDSQDPDIPPGIAVYAIEQLTAVDMVLGVDLWVKLITAEDFDTHALASGKLREAALRLTPEAAVLMDDRLAGLARSVTSNDPIAEEMPEWLVERLRATVWNELWWEWR